jgi:hypothetical protein
VLETDLPNTNAKRALISSTTAAVKALPDAVPSSNAATKS